MNNQTVEDFNLYLQNYKELTLTEKQRIVFNKMKELAVITSTFCQEIGSNNKVIINQELADLLQPNYTEDDFAEAMLVLETSIQNSICDFHARNAEILAKNIN